MIKPLKWSSTFKFPNQQAKTAGCQSLFCPLHASMNHSVKFDSTMSWEVLIWGSSSQANVMKQHYLTESHLRFGLKMAMGGQPFFSRESKLLHLPGLKFDLSIGCLMINVNVNMLIHATPYWSLPWRHVSLSVCCVIFSRRQRPGPLNAHSLTRLCLRCSKTLYWPSKQDRRVAHQHHYSFWICYKSIRHPMLRLSICWPTYSHIHTICHIHNYP